MQIRTKLRPSIVFQNKKTMIILDLLIHIDILLYIPQLEDKLYYSPLRKLPGKSPKPNLMILINNNY